MQEISNLAVYTGIIPNKTTQSEKDFANNVFGFLNYSGNIFVVNLNDIIDELNILSGQINVKAGEVETNASNSQTAFQNAQNAIALLTAGSIDDIVIATNKAYSNTKVNQLLSVIENKKGNSIASNATITIGTAGLGDYIHITGTTTIDSLGTATTAGTRRTLIFDAALTLTHNATSLICPGATSISTTAGMVIEVIAETTSYWRVVSIYYPLISAAELSYLDGVTSAIQTQFNTKAPLASPALTGVPTAPTASAGTNNTQIATTAYVDGKFVRGTAVNSTSGTSIDFTGIPSWAKRITIIFNGVSTNGTAWKLIQIGSGSIQTTGYTSTGSSISAAPASTNASTGFLIQSISATDTISGIITLTNISGNLWICNHSAKSSGNTTCVGGGDITLAGALDRLRITTTNGTDTFDAGSINIMYEG